jgi:predicted phosphodiesterase
MLIQLMSDLHLEHHRDGGAAFLDSLDPTGVDVLVLAGDILQARSELRKRAVLEAFAARYPQVLFVPGNHEYYGSTPSEVDRQLSSVEIPNVHVLNPGVIVLAGQRFVGATLWFPPSVDEEEYRWLLTDFRAIGGFYPWVHETHAAQRWFLEAQVQPGDVVITHHLPALDSIDPRFTEAPTNRFFWAQADDLVREKRARLWLHGHTHAHVDYVLGETRVMANPRGYPGELGCRYQERLLIEV